MNNNTKTKLTTKQLVVCGILLAVSMVLLYLASVIPGMELTLMAAVGAIVFLVCANTSFRAGRIFYVASVLLALIVAPGKIIILPYIFCLGPYGLIKYGAEKFSLKLDDDVADNFDNDSNEEDSNGTEGQPRLNRVEIRLSDDESDYVPIENDFASEENPNKTEYSNESNMKNSSKLKKCAIEYLLKIVGFAACISVCMLFIMFVMGVSPSDLILNGSLIGSESGLFAKIDIRDLAYPIIVIAVIAVFILYDNIIRLINAVFGKYMR